MPGQLAPQGDRPAQGRIQRQERGLLLSQPIDHDLYRMSFTGTDHRLLDLVTIPHAFGPGQARSIRLGGTVDPDNLLGHFGAVRFLGS